MLTILTGVLLKNEGFKKDYFFILTLVFIFTSYNPAFSSSSLLGKPCTKLKVTAVRAGIDYICVTKNGKKQWILSKAKSVNPPKLVGFKNIIFLGTPQLISQTIANNESPINLYVVRNDGSNLRKLVDFPVAYYRVSQDGSKIVFVGGKPQNTYIMNSDGTGLFQIIDFFGKLGEPTFSPDASKIVYSTFSGGSFRIFSVNIDNNARTPLTEFDSVSPIFSPDGSKILFSSVFVKNRKQNLYVMDSDGKNQIQLTNNPGGDNFPAWSPDSSQIAFLSDFGGQLGLWVMNANGSNKRRLSSPLAFAFMWAPSWNPKGTSISYTAYDSSNVYPGIRVINVDGSGETILSPSGLVERRPAWSPDGTQIVFESNRSGVRFQLYLMKSDGTSQVLLTSGMSLAYVPSWVK